MITLFLGAGASKPFGYPTTEDFIQYSNEQFSENQLYKNLQTFLKRDKEIIDIELILWELKEFIECIDSMSKPNTFQKWFFMDSNKAFYQVSPSSNQSFNPALSNIKHNATELVSDINRLVYDIYWKKANNEAIKFYKTFLQSFGNHEINIFTTNYDLVIERTFQAQSEVFSDGFTPYHSSHFYWDENNYKNARIKLYKLHGSIDWKKYSDGKVIRFPIHDFTQHDDHVIIYPGFKGIIEQAPFKAMHEIFETSLQVSKLSIFIGFSFRDDHINEIITRAMNQNSTSEIILWNPQKIDLLKKLSLNIPQRKFIYFDEHFGKDESSIERLRSKI